MSQIHDALQKVKASHLGTAGKRLGKPKPSPRKNTLVENVPPAVADSVLGRDARRIALDPEILQKNRVVTTSDTPGMNTAYKMLRTRVLQRLRSNHWKCLAVSSARPGAGKTLTAINTAISLSFEPNQRVILVDLDLRRPTIARYLGLKQKYGLSDYLHKNVSLDKIIVRPKNIDRLMILPNFHAYEHSSELLSSPKMVELVELLADPSHSTIVIFDLPPLLDADDVLAFSPLFDALLMVVSQNETRRMDLQKSFELLHDIVVLGVVMNKSKGGDDAPGYY
jgi:capsular exopolysaccharide synthesis family protein